MNNAEYWEKARLRRPKDAKRERKVFYYLTLSITSILGGTAGITYGLIGLSWIQKPYVILGGVLLLFGLSIVIGGYGKVKA